MSRGTITDFDVEGQFGVIVSDDGRLILFNLRAVPPPLCECVHVGTRVEFGEENSPLGPRATGLDPVDWSASGPRKTQPHADVPSAESTPRTR